MRKASNNRKRVLNMIRNKGPIGRAQIARETELTIPSIMQITQDFLAMELIEEVGKGQSTGGKPPILLDLIQDAYYSIGVDVGADNIICVLMDTVNIVARIILPTEFEKGFSHVLKQIESAIENVLGKLERNSDKLIGIGVAVPGLLDMQTKKVLFSPDIGWKDVDIITPLKEQFKTYVCIENATRATAYGEKLFGCTKDIDNYMCVNLGYGIGGALVFNGKIHAGQSGTAGELGHMTVVPDGPVCDCGNKGCLEAVASARAVVRDMKNRIAEGEHSILQDELGEDLEGLDAKVIYDAAKKGDPLATAIVENSIEVIGRTLAGIINLLDCEMIVLEGGVSRNGEYFLERLHKAVEMHKMNCAGRDTKIVVSTLGVNATAIGAASIVVNQLLEGEEEVVNLLTT